MPRLESMTFSRWPTIGIAITIALLMMTAGCTVGPNYVAPKSWSPAHWFAQPAASGDRSPVTSQTVAAPIRADWWAIFGDPELTSLEARAAANNFGVDEATLRLAESRAQRQITGADALPTVTGDGSYARQRVSPLGEFSLLGGSGGSSSSGSASNSGGAGGVPSSSALPPFSLWQYGFDASWELDLWGRVRREIEAADASVEASAEARRDMLLSTMAEVARDYFQLRGVQTMQQIAKANQQIAERTLALTTQQARHGLTTGLQVANAAATLSNLTATIPQLDQNEAQAINQLSFLLGLPPRALSTELKTARALPPLPPQVPIGLPSQLAERRPDIREAEARLHSAIAQIGVARASFYPRVTLSGSLDIQALQFTQLSNWDARTYQFGPSISIPLFQGGRLTGNLRLAKTEQKLAAVTYQQTVLNAWQEVDNALFAYQEEQRRNKQLQAEVAQAQQALTLAQRQYFSGMTDFLYVLDAQRQVLSAERDEAESAVTASTDLVSIYKALGGGWVE